MKKVSLIRRLATIVVALCLFSTFAFADGEISEVYLTGTSTSSAGDFVVQTTAILWCKPLVTCFTIWVVNMKYSGFIMTTRP